MARFRMAPAFLAGLLFLVAAAPAVAQQTLRWTDRHDIDNTYTCGVVEETTATIDGTAYFDSDGTWVKDILRFSYEATLTDPVSGRTVAFGTRQVVLATPQTLAFAAQGLFIRVPASGAVLLDVGRLVVDPADGRTVFASAKVLGFDDPSVRDRLDAAVCSLF